MALIICPECTGQLSTLALACPHCGMRVGADANSERHPHGNSPASSVNLPAAPLAPKWSNEEVSQEDPAPRREIPTPTATTQEDGTTTRGRTPPKPESADWRQPFKVAGKWTLHGGMAFWLTLKGCNLTKPTGSAFSQDMIDWYNTTETIRTLLWLYLACVWLVAGIVAISRVFRR
jgi:hypothetical protein